MNKDTIDRMNQIRNQRSKEFKGESYVAKPNVTGQDASQKIDDATLEMFDVFGKLYNALDTVKSFIKKQSKSLILTHWRFMTWVLDDHVETIEDLLDYINESKETK